MFNELKDEIIVRLGPLSPSPNGFQKRNCMMCDLRGQGVDKRKRFGILCTTDSISVNCFNCAFKASWKVGHELSGSFKAFMRRIGFTDESIKKISFDIFKNKLTLTPDDKVDTRYSVISKWVHMDLPEVALPIQTWAENGCDDPDFIKVCEYAESRNLRDFHKLLWAPERTKNLSRRLIIPFTYKDRTVGYTARYYIEHPAANIPKYLNYMPSSFLYNFDKQMEYKRKYVILCEGILDAYQMDGTSPLGSINNDQADMIDSLKKQIIVVPDRDKSGAGLYDMAVARGWSISFPTWEAGIKDPAKASEKYGVVLTLQNILDNVEKDSLYLKVRRKLTYDK